MAAANDLKPKAFQTVTALTLPIVQPQPIPLSTQTIHEETPDGPWTTISRVFMPEDVHRCQLCPRQQCKATEYGHCLVKVPVDVPNELAPTFPLLGNDRTVAVLMARRDRPADNG